MDASTGIVITNIGIQAGDGVYIDCSTNDLSSSQYLVDIITTSYGPPEMYEGTDIGCFINAGEFYRDSEDNTYTSISSIDNERHEYLLYPSGVRVDDVHYPATSSGNYSFLGCKRSNYSSYIYWTYSPFNGKVYRIILFNNEDIRADLIPCTQDSTNISGLYDTVEGVFRPLRLFNYLSSTGRLTYAAKSQLTVSYVTRSTLGGGYSSLLSSTVSSGSTAISGISSYSTVAYAVISPFYDDYYYYTPAENFYTSSPA